MPVFTLDSILEFQCPRRWSWRRPQFTYNHPCRLQLSRPRRRALRQVTFGSVEAGDGVTITGPGPVAIGVRPFTGVTTFIGNIRITGAVSGATKVFTASTVADKRYTPPMIRKPPFGAAFCQFQISLNRTNRGVVACS